MLPVSSTPSFSWHLPSDELVFCTSALVLLGLTPETAPRRMEDLLALQPEARRPSLQALRRAVQVRGGRELPVCSYTLNGKDICEHWHVVQRDAGGRPQTLLACLEVQEDTSLPAGGGYWTYFREQGNLLLDARCASLLGLASVPGALDRKAVRRICLHYRAVRPLARLRRWLDIPLMSGRQSLVLMSCRSDDLPLLLVASVLERDDTGRARIISGSLAPFLPGKTGPTGDSDRLVLAMDACSDGLWDWDVPTGKVYFSQNYLSMLGHTRESYPGELSSWTGSVHPEDYDKTVALQMRIMASPAEGDAFACTYRIRRADGSWLWVLGRGCVTSRDSEGRALRAIGMHTDISSLQRDRTILEEQIRLDPLTGVYNRYHFDSLLRQLRKYEGPLCVLMIDVNGLKMINDHLGHHVGDELLRTVARHLVGHVRQEDCLARIGGDEFVLVLRCSGEVVQRRLITIRKALAAWNDGGDLPLELSFGLATSEDGSVPPETLLRQADARMMREKELARTASHARIRAWLESRTGRSVRQDDPRI